MNLCSKQWLILEPAGTWRSELSCVCKQTEPVSVLSSRTEGGEDGGRGRRGDHLPPHRYIRNTSTRGTAPTENLLNAGRRPQTSQKARNSPRTWVGQKKKEITETKNRDGTCTSGREQPNVPSGAITVAKWVFSCLPGPCLAKLSLGTGIPLKNTHTHTYTEIPLKYKEGPTDTRMTGAG